MSEFTNHLSDAEAERLAILSEECGEVIQAVSKILRHGYLSRNPNLPDGSIGNRCMLEKEIGDVRWAVEAMIEAKDVNNGEIEGWKVSKAEKARPYLHHQSGESRRVAGKAEAK